MRSPEKVARGVDQDQKRGLTHKRDVKNEGTSGDVHENTGNLDTMSSNKRGFLHENAPILGKSANQSGFLAKNVQHA
jgi:hypothetical protein